MNRVIQHIIQPLPFVKNRWLIVLFPTLWVFLLAILLKPFDFEYSFSKVWIPLSYASVATFSCSFVIYVFPLLFKTYFAPNKFTNGKFYLACISIILIATILCCFVAYYVAMIEDREIIYSTIERFFLWFLTVSFIAFFPIVIVYASLKNTRLKMIQKELKENLELDFFHPNSRESLVVLGENTKVPLKLALNKLLYIEALGNDIMVHYTKNNSIQQKQFRETLVQIMDKFKDYPQIVRCHRSFVVNTDNVTFAQNAQVNQLVVNISNTKIPVSRSYTKEVREKITS